MNQRFRLLFSSVLFGTTLLAIGCVTSSLDNTLSLVKRNPTPTAEQGNIVKQSTTSSNYNQPYDLGNSLSNTAIDAVSIDELIKTLKETGMWSLTPESELSPLLVNSFPAGLNELDVQSKKKVFFNTLLPVVMMVQQEVQGERQQLLTVLAKLDEPPNQLLTLSESYLKQQKNLSKEELLFIKGVTKKYRHKNAAELLKRVNVVPASLVLAQGALESSWGTSRFASMGNNLFGMWTWGARGIVPLDRSAGLTHKIAVYDSIIDSVRAYVLTLNRIPAYAKLRELRSENMDPAILAQGLIYYSERRLAYVEDLQSIIKHNNLTAYDRFRLAASTKLPI